MQTFLPYDSFKLSAECLDRQRLSKQRIEALQVLRAITDESYGWQNHPCVKMWRGYERCLALYGCVICEEWTRRGYLDTCRKKILDIASPKFDPPLWLGYPSFHNSHRSNLLRKNSEHYRKYFRDLSDSYPYVWPDLPCIRPGDRVVCSYDLYGPGNYRIGTVAKTGLYVCLVIFDGDLFETTVETKELLPASDPKTVLLISGLKS